MNTDIETERFLSRVASRPIGNSLFRESSIAREIRQDSGKTLEANVAKSLTYDMIHGMVVDTVLKNMPFHIIH